MIMIEMLEKLEDIYRQMSAEAKHYQENEAILCLPACGICCESHEVQACVFEMMPAAIYLIQNHLDIKYYSLLDVIPMPEICVFYEPQNRQEGCCALYEKRAAICRLFGAGRIKDKHGNPRLSICKKIKEHNSFKIEQISLSKEKILLAPDMEFWHRMVLNLAPMEYSVLFPINQALKEALQICWWEYSFDGPNDPIFPSAA